MNVFELVCRPTSFGKRRPLLGCQLCLDIHRLPMPNFHCTIHTHHTCAIRSNLCVGGSSTACQSEASQSEVPRLTTLRASIPKPTRPEVAGPIQTHALPSSCGAESCLLCCQADQSRRQCLPEHGGLLHDSLAHCKLKRGQLSRWMPGHGSNSGATLLSPRA